MFRFTQGLYFFVLMSLCLATASTAARLPMDHQVAFAVRDVPSAAASRSVGSISYSPDRDFAARRSELARRGLLGDLVGIVNDLLHLNISGVGEEIKQAIGDLGFNKVENTTSSTMSVNPGIPTSSALQKAAASSSVSTRLHTSGSASAVPTAAATAARDSPAANVKMMRRSLIGDLITLIEDVTNNNLTNVGQDVKNILGELGIARRDLDEHLTSLPVMKRSTPDTPADAVQRRALVNDILHLVNDTLHLNLGDLGNEAKGLLSKIDINLKRSEAEQHPQRRALLGHVLSLVNHTVHFNLAELGDEAKGLLHKIDIDVSRRDVVEATPAQHFERRALVQDITNIINDIIHFNGTEAGQDAKGLLRKMNVNVQRRDDGDDAQRRALVPDIISLVNDIIHFNGTEAGSDAKGLLRKLNVKINRRDGEDSHIDEMQRRALVPHIIDLVNDIIHFNGKEAGEDGKNLLRKMNIKINRRDGAEPQPQRRALVNDIIALVNDVIHFNGTEAGQDGKALLRKMNIQIKRDAEAPSSPGEALARRGLIDDIIGIVNDILNLNITDVERQAKATLRKIDIDVQKRGEDDAAPIARRGLVDDIIGIINDVLHLNLTEVGSDGKQLLHKLNIDVQRRDGNGGNTHPVPHFSDEAASQANGSSDDSGDDDGEGHDSDSVAAAVSQADSTASPTGSAKAKSNAAGLDFDRGASMVTHVATAKATSAPTSAASAASGASSDFPTQPALSAADSSTSSSASSSSSSSSAAKADSTASPAAAAAATGAPSGDTEVVIIVKAESASASTTLKFSGAEATPTASDSASSSSAAESASSSTSSSSPLATGSGRSAAMKVQPFMGNVKLPERAASEPADESDSAKPTTTPTASGATEATSLVPSGTYSWFPGAFGCPQPTSGAKEEKDRELKKGKKKSSKKPGHYSTSANRDDAWCTAVATPTTAKVPASPTRTATSSSTSAAKNSPSPSAGPLARRSAKGSNRSEAKAAKEEAKKQVNAIAAAQASAIREAMAGNENGMRRWKASLRQE